MTKIVSFNVNSIKARLPNFLLWLKQSKPDIVCLQELKCEEQNFPFEAIFDAGYNAVVNGQKTYNGVAIISKFKIEEVNKTLPMLDANQELDQQARYIEAVLTVKNKAIRVSSIYVPNGGGDLAENERLEDSKKFLYKLEFFDRLNNHLQQLLKYNEIQFFAGDYNVAVANQDIYDPELFKNQVLFHPIERQKMQSLLNLGLVDCYRILNPNQSVFSWWDYRKNCYQKNHGARIDYILASPLASDLLNNSVIENLGVRDQEKASDHCPVAIEIDL
jgi:exodeoxyribonuclease-3